MHAEGLAQLLIRTSSTMSIDWPSALQPKPVNGAVMKRTSPPRRLRIAKASDRMVPTSSFWSTVRCSWPRREVLESDRVGQGLRAQGLEHQRLDEGVLALATGDVAFAELLALAVEDEGGLAVMCGALPEDLAVALGGLLDLDVDSAHGVGHVLESLEAEQVAWSTSIPSMLCIVLTRSGAPPKA